MELDQRNKLIDKCQHIINVIKRSLAKYKVIVTLYDQLVLNSTKHSRGQDNIKMNKRNKTKQDWDSLNFFERFKQADRFH